jgi:alpha/beta superfamily hydrolase
MLREWARDVGRIVEVPGADHFLEGRLDELEKAIGGFLAELPTRRS